LLTFIEAIEIIRAVTVKIKGVIDAGYRGVARNFLRGGARQQRKSLTLRIIF
jgi:hypothetical protein